MARSTITINDYSNEQSGFTVYAPELTAGNIVAQTGLATALHDAVVDLTIGEVVAQTVQQILVDEPATPTDPFAHREMKWLVRYRGATSGKMYSIEIAAPSLTDNLVLGSDLADTTSADWVAFISAFEAYARTPDNISALVEFVDARLVGRNL